MAYSISFLEILVKSLSYLEEDDKNLTRFQRKIKHAMFEGFEKALRENGVQEEQIQTYLTKLITDPTFNPSKEFSTEILEKWT